MIKKYYKQIIYVFLAIVLFYGIIYIDITLRARKAYLTAERYLDWSVDTQKKEQYFKEKYEKEKMFLDKKLAKGKISQQDYDIQTEMLKFKIEQQKQESSLKYAYIWYKTAIELFSPPETKWVKLAKEKLEPTKQLWKKELESKGYKVEDYMIE
ncbi:MAG: hypothetical protein SNJ64_05760 [Endomicrobiia bacterium]